MLRKSAVKIRPLGMSSERSLISLPAQRRRLRASLAVCIRVVTDETSRQATQWTTMYSLSMDPEG